MCSITTGILGFVIGIMITVFAFTNQYDAALDKYKKCRYYDQTIERCVTELGWEKK